MPKARMVIIWTCVLGVCLTSPVVPMELNWDDINHFPWPIAGAEWVAKNESQKAAYLELVYSGIQYCTKNAGKRPKELDLTQSGPYIVNFPRITPEVIAMYYRIYGDLQKAAETKYKYWADSKHNPALGSAEEDPLGFVMNGYEEAGMYQELLSLFPIAYEDMLQRISIGTDTKLVKTKFTEYERNWPTEAGIYARFMKSWDRAKKLSKTAKPKPLDPAVQNHEWFYSDKQEEVLKALEYYHKHDVRFMLEKAAKFKDPVIAAKAKEYLDNPVKETVEPEPASDKPNPAMTKSPPDSPVKDTGDETSK